MECILNGVLPLICHLLTKMNQSTLKYLLSSLSNILILNINNSIYKYESEIIPIIINLWSKNCLNQDITFYIKKIISTFVSIKECQICSIKHIIPTILDIFSTKDCDICVLICSLGILNILMINTFKQKNQHNIINNIYYKQCLPKILDLVYNTKDNSLINICLKIICNLINNNPKFIINENFVEYICQIISKFLSDSIPENATNGIGPLINQLIINLKCTLNDTMFTNLLLTIINRINNCFTTN